MPILIIHLKAKAHHINANKSTTITLVLQTKEKVCIQIRTAGEGDLFLAVFGDGDLADDLPAGTLMELRARPSSSSSSSSSADWCDITCASLWAAALAAVFCGRRKVAEPDEPVRRCRRAGEDTGESPEALDMLLCLTYTGLPERNRSMTGGDFSVVTEW